MLMRHRNKLGASPCSSTVWHSSDTVANKNFRMLSETYQPKIYLFIYFAGWELDIFVGTVLWVLCSMTSFPFNSFDGLPPLRILLDLMYIGLLLSFFGSIWIREYLVQLIVLICSKVVANPPCLRWISIHPGFKRSRVWSSVWCYLRLYAFPHGVWSNA